MAVILVYGVAESGDADQIRLREEPPAGLRHR